MVLHKNPMAISSVVGAKHFSQCSKKFRFGFFQLKIFRHAEKRSDLVW